MELTLPVYVEVRKSGGRPIHHCRPLFFSGPLVRDAHFGLAMSKLARVLKPLLDELGQDGQHQTLAAWAFSPPLDTHVMKLEIDLKDRRAQTKLLLIVFATLGRRVAFSPALPDLWFEVLPSENLPDRARAVVTQHFRNAEKRARRAGDAPNTPEQLALPGQAWVTTIDLPVNTRPLAAKKRERELATLFDETRVDGSSELSRVGRCLDWLYPHQLHRAVERDEEVSRLFHWLDTRDNRPIALVGPRLSGKTTVLHEVVRRRVARRAKPFGAKRNVWLLSPQRLISGMMYVGQWEGRVQAILKTARKRRHVLYFDDFLGLYQAGLSRDAQLSVADMLRPYIQRRDIRVLIEMTPEAFHAFAERDRGLADQFDVLRVEALGIDVTRRIMLNVQRELELQHRTRFDLEALPAILRLHASYQRDAAYPGKAAAFSRQLARKHAGGAISRDAVFLEFHRKTGLSLSLLDDHQTLDRKAVVDGLRKKVVSQDEAVEAAADVVSVAKARLAATDRPLATLLFLGPTGVGKTHCAKALAEAMYSDANRLLRYDMNEFMTPHAVAQLVGTLSESDGLLTSAVRRQPFAVVLLDEIEKAHPDVFDLLLQVTGEGRLTDAWGRTADFSNAVIVMTSNLGTTASNQPLGLAPELVSRQQAFVRAAENFFRPELFNRIDRIIPFAPLARDEMRKIAEMTLADVFRRDGLVRRRCALSIEPAAMTRVVDAGYHPQFGARALKRAIERQLVQPVAAALAGVKPELPALISIVPQGDGVRAAVVPLESVPLAEQSLSVELDPPEQLLRAGRFAQRVAHDVESLRPSGSFAGSGLSPQQVLYFAVKEQLHQFRELLEHAQKSALRHAQSPIKPGLAPRQVTYAARLAGGNYRDISERRILREIQAADDIHEFLRDHVAEPSTRGGLSDQLEALLREAALLHAVVSSAHESRSLLLLIKPLVSTARASGESLRRMFHDLLSETLALAVRWLPAAASGELHAAEVSGPGAWPIVTAEGGVHMWCQFHEHLQPVALWAVPRNDQPGLAQFAALIDERRQWLERLARHADSGEADPWPVGSIVRFYDESGPSLDLRSGLTSAQLPTPAEHRTWILAGLPLPPELEM